MQDNDHGAQRAMRQRDSRVRGTEAQRRRHRNGGAIGGAGTNSQPKMPKPAASTAAAASSRKPGHTQDSTKAHRNSPSDPGR